MNKDFPKTLFREEVLQQTQTPQFGKVLDTNKKCSKNLVKFLIAFAAIIIGTIIIEYPKISMLALHLANK